MMLLPAITQTRGTLDSLLNKIHHADALDLLRRLPDASIDMVLCDLPYGVTACEWDTIIPIEPMWKELRRVVKKRSAIVLTATQPFTSRLVSSNYKMFRYEWIWEKEQGTNFLDAWRKPYKVHESILVFSSDFVPYNPQLSEGNPYINGKHRGTSVYGKFNDKQVYKDHGRLPRSIIQFLRETGFHPTQKPVALFEYLIKTYTQPNEIVLDMTCGSGTTAIAARKTGRQFICGDLSAEYVEVARKRLQNTDPYQATILPDGTKQLSLFENIS